MSETAEILNYLPGAAAVQAAAVAAVLREPGSVALVPTETVYGLVARQADPEAVKQIYNLKGRNFNKPLALFASSLAVLEPFGAVVTPGARKLFAAFCPGALTLVLPTLDGGTIGLRYPKHALLEELLQILGEPLASTSANGADCGDVSLVFEALDQLNGTPDIIIDSGVLPPGAQASTVVMLSKLDELKILRPGPVSEEELRQVLASEI